MAKSSANRSSGNRGSKGGNQGTGKKPRGCWMAKQKPRQTFWWRSKQCTVQRERKIIADNG